MNWKFWKRKKKIVLTLDELMERIETTRISKEGKEPTICPPVQRESSVCACINCPIKKDCLLERMCAASDCTQTFITSCSRKKELLGEFNVKEETVKDDGGSPLSGDPGVLAEGVCGEPSGGGIRDSQLVSANGDTGLRLDNIGED